MPLNGLSRQTGLRDIAGGASRTRCSVAAARIGLSAGGVKPLTKRCGSAQGVAVMAVKYDVAGICLNGHLVTSVARSRVGQLAYPVTESAASPALDSSGVAA